jgi:DNA-3-methyladenine glycosylase II
LHSSTNLFALSLTVRLDGPIDYAASLEMFRRSGDDLLDRWDGTTFVRTITIDGSPIAYACTFEQARDSLNVRLTVEDSRFRDDIESLVRSMFVMPPPNFADLLNTDPVIAALDARYPAVRSVRQANLFNALLRCITTQQVNLRWAATCRRRLAETFGRAHSVGGHCVYRLDPAQIAGLEVADIRALQLTNRKAEYIINAARAIASGDLTVAVLDTLTDDEIIARLTAIPGIGLWSAEWILARTLGRPRVVAGDLGVRKAVALAYPVNPSPPEVRSAVILPPEARSGGILPPEINVRRATAHWGESAAVIQTLLLHALAEKTLADIAAQAAKAAKLAAPAATP